MIMKRSNFLVLLMGVLGLVLVNCGKKPEPTTKQLDPTVSLSGETGFISSDATVTPGSDISFKVMVAKGTDGAKLQTFTVTKDDKRIGGGPQTYANVDIKNKEAYTWTDTFNVGTAEGNIIFNFEVTDKDGRKASTSITITVQAAQGPVAPKSLTNITLSYDSTNGYGAKSFYSTKTEQYYDNTSASGAASSIDFAFFYSGTSGNNIVSPLDLNNGTIYGSFAINWGSVNTEFRTASVVKADFDTLSVASALKTWFDSGTPVKAVCGQNQQCTGTRLNNSVDTNVAQDKVILFKGADGKYGALVFKSVANGAITMDIKVEP